MFILFDHGRVLVNVKDIKTITRYRMDDDSSLRISINLFILPSFHHYEEIYEKEEEHNKRWDELVEIMLKVK